MCLKDVLAKLGYSFRLHREEVSWTWFEPTVVDLPPFLANALSMRGVGGLRAEIERLLYKPERGLWTFPSYDIEAPLPRCEYLTLAKNGKPAVRVVAPAEHPDLLGIARDWLAEVKKRFGVDLSLTNPDELSFEELAERDIVVFGGSHRNAFALELTHRGCTPFIDASVPGPGGWVVTTHCGLHASGKAVLHIEAGDACEAEVIGLLMGGLSLVEGELRQAYLHKIKPGALQAEKMPSWEDFAEAAARRIVQLRGESYRVPPEPEELSRFLAVGLESGGREKGAYNVAPLDIANDAAHYYRISGDARALGLFRALLFRLADYYLRTPGGAAYPADLDFRSGLLVLNFARLEHEPIFTDEERLLMANLLLSCSRSVHEYAAKFWAVDRYPTSRHNHQSFPALSLAYAADYFSRFNLPYVERWREYTRGIFSGELWGRSKQLENSRAYEPFVYAHAGACGLFSGEGFGRFDDGIIQRVVEREIITTDNFLRGVDYSDTAVSMAAADSVLARMAASDLKGAARWYSTAGFERQPRYVMNMFLDHAGLRMEAVDEEPESGVWEEAPLDAVFREEVAPGFPARLAFDKLAYRTGWRDEDHYLLIEGVGGEVSHAHREVNGVVRLNHLGRHWVVSNGYGRRVGVTNTGQGFATRERGPADHNMLVLRRGGEIATDLSLGAALQRCGKGDLLWFTGAQLKYGGVDWFRTYIVVRGRYVLALDRMSVLEAGLESAHVEWNCLGRAQALENGFRLEQQGVFFDVVGTSGMEVELLFADQSSDWKDVLESGAYPYASFPLAKPVFRFPRLDAGRKVAFATLLAAHDGDAPLGPILPEPGCLVVQGTPGGAPVEVRDGDLRLRLEDGELRVEFDELPAVPAELADWSGSR